MDIKRIKSIEGVFEIIMDQQCNKKIDRYRHSYLYRGLNDGGYHLQTSLYRNCKEKQWDLEKSMLRNFAKYASMDDPLLKESIWRQMIIGQHHGLPTRLLDWTYSPIAGLHFATISDNLSNLDKKDCILWRIDIEELNSLLPQKYQDILKKENANLFTTDMLTKVVSDLTIYDQEMKDESLVLLEPHSIDQRIINQYSYFLIVPQYIEDIEVFLERKTEKTTKYIIDKSIRWQLRDMLDQMNSNERIMYPGLDGLSSWLKRHYYVK